MLEEHHPLGNTRITVSDDEFTTGYQCGYLSYHTDFAGRPALSEMEVYAYILDTITSRYQSPRWNTGAVAGWLAALQERRAAARTPEHIYTCPTCGHLATFSQLTRRPDSTLVCCFCVCSTPTPVHEEPQDAQTLVQASAGEEERS